MNETVLTRLVGGCVLYKIVRQNLKTSEQIAIMHVFLRIPTQCRESENPVLIHLFICQQLLDKTLMKKIKPVVVDKIQFEYLAQTNGVFLRFQSLRIPVQWRKPHALIQLYKL